jgi:hypothetical protein
VVSRARKTTRINPLFMNKVLFIKKKKRLVNHCAMPSIGQTWVLASIGAVVEMGIF